LPAAEYALSHGAVITESIDRETVGDDTLELMAILLKHGWDINRPFTNESPPALAYVPLSSLIE
jgi:hypothetical protein